MSPPNAGRPTIQAIAAQAHQFARQTLLAVLRSRTAARHARELDAAYNLAEEETRRADAAEAKLRLIADGQPAELMRMLAGGCLDASSARLAAAAVLISAQKVVLRDLTPQQAADALGPEWRILPRSSWEALNARGRYRGGDVQ